MKPTPRKTTGLIVLQHLFEEMKAQNVKSIPIETIEQILIKYKVID
jgi:hypothetical protein